MENFFKSLFKISVGLLILGPLLYIPAFFSRSYAEGAYFVLLPLPLGLGLGVLSLVGYMITYLFRPKKGIEFEDKR